MAEYIGARISLISNADIRYVGTLREINSTDSTVKLENVRSMGTEDRRSGPGSIAPNDRLYESIVFRGSDVKDLRIEEPPKAAPKKEEVEVPDDPAILSSTRRPQQAATPNQSQHPPFGQPPPYGQGFPPYPPPMHNQGFGRGGFPPGPGGPGFGYPQGPGPYGAPPPGWFPPGQGFPGPGGPPPGPFSPQPPGPPQQQPGGQHPRQQAPPAAPQKDARIAEQTPAEALSKADPGKAFPSAPKQAPTPPVETKPDVAAATAPPAKAAQAPPTGPKGRVPIPRNPAPKAAPQPAAAAQAQNAQAAANTAQSFASATQAATAAVAAAMAKLPMAQKMGQGEQKGGADNLDNLTKKVQDMRTDDHIRHGRQQGTGGHVAGHRGRGRGRGGQNQQSRPVDVPTTDYDFESANAKFNRDDLAKEAIATGSPIGTAGDSAANGAEVANGEAKESEASGRKASEAEVVIPKAEQVYDKKSSFFDNISSELKDKEERRGQEFRSEERKKNMETFGQGSVDNNYRRGFGRGRGRGFRGGGRGGFGQRGGGNRGGNYNNYPRGGAATTES